MPTKHSGQQAREGHCSRARPSSHPPLADDHEAGLRRGLHRRALTLPIVDSETMPRRGHPGKRETRAAGEAGVGGPCGPASEDHRGARESLGWGGTHRAKNGRPAARRL